MSHIRTYVGPEHEPGPVIEAEILHPWPDTFEDGYHAVHVLHAGSGTETVVVRDQDLQDVEG